MASEDPSYPVSEPLNAEQATQMLAVWRQHGMDWFHGHVERLIAEPSASWGDGACMTLVVSTDPDPLADHCRPGLVTRGWRDFYDAVQKIIERYGVPRPRAAARGRQDLWGRRQAPKVLPGSGTAAGMPSSLEPGAAALLRPAAGRAAPRRAGREVRLSWRRLVGYAGSPRRVGRGPRR